jgi:hypothetical protein
MINFAISIQLADLDAHWIEVPCPSCRLETWTRLGEIKRGEYIICRGCHANIHLIDHLGQVKGFTQSLERVLGSFGA